MSFDFGLESLTISETRRRSPSGKKAESVMKLLRDDERFSTLVEHLEKSSDLSDDIDSSKDITFFAPTNQAFRNYDKFMSGSGAEASGFEKERSMKEVIRYHISRDSAVFFDDMYEGQLLTSNLKEKSLENNYQKIRVTKFLGGVILNYVANIIEADLETENGVVHVLGNVMCPPKPMLEQIYNVPFAFSTFTSAMQCAGLQEKLNQDKAITCLIPINAAWKQMHMFDLIYLFSAAGARDLKKVLEYHMCKDLVYACDIMKDEKVELETYCKDEKLVIRATERRIMEESFGEHNPQKWILCVNQGESTVKRTDFLARNGNVQMISTVLIPDCVCLPSMRDSKEREDHERRRDGNHSRGRRDDDHEERRRRRKGCRDGRRRSFQ
jgi:uncharacterized surface protein with fasciclin (FAS1) repeats